MFVCQMPLKDKLTLYKKFKGYYLFETGTWNVNEFKPILDEKVKDVIDVLDYEITINPLVVYNEYVNGVYR